MTPTQERYILRICFATLGLSWFATLISASKLKDGFEQLKAEHLTLYEQVRYLLARLEQEGIDLDNFMDEFDLIALRNLEHPKESL